MEIDQLLTIFSEVDTPLPTSVQSFRKLLATVNLRKAH
jgi:hypothetical protein